MTPSALYAGAVSAMRLARQCERDMNSYDADWAREMRAEAKRHRKRAEGYLISRASLLRDIHPPKLEIAA